MILYKTKIYNSLVSIRSDELKRLKRGDTLTIIYNGDDPKYKGQTFTLSYSQAKNKKLQVMKKRIQSKIYLGQSYILYDYMWKPDKPLTDEEYFRKYNI
jgi:hypothetical protein